MASLRLGEFDAVKIGRSHYRRFHEWERRRRDCKIVTVAGVKLIKLPTIKETRKWLKEG